MLLALGKTQPVPTFISSRFTPPSTPHVSSPASNSAVSNLSHRSRDRKGGRLCHRFPQHRCVSLNIGGQEARSWRWLCTCAWFNLALLGAETRHRSMGGKIGAVGMWMLCEGRARAHCRKRRQIRHQRQVGSWWIIGLGRNLDWRDVNRLRSVNSFTL